MSVLRDNSARAQQTITMFQGLAVVLVLVILSDFWYVSVVGRDESTADLDTTALGIAHNLLGLVELVLLLVCFVLFVSWLRRAYWNLRALGRNMEHGDGWAVGAWFVPFLNMFRPYSIVREVWRETQVVAFEQASPHGLLRAWWLLFVVHGLVSNVTNRMSGSANTVEQLQSAAWANIFTAILMLATALLTIMVVRRIAGYEAQMDLRLQVSRLGGIAPKPVSELLEDQSDYQY